MTSQTSPWDIDPYCMKANLCFLFPRYKKRTECAVNCKTCKFLGCSKPSVPDPRWDGVSNLCRLHLHWYNVLDKGIFNYGAMERGIASKA